METQDLKKDINKRLSEINDKIKQLKKKLEAERENLKLQKLLTQLEAIRDSIIHQYNELNSMTLGAKDQIKQLEMAIVESIRSFDNAFKKVVQKLKDSETEESSHPTGFDKPGNTKQP